MTYVAYSTQFDAALLSLYAFWLLFVLLILYLRNEDRREGYPLVHEQNGRLLVVNPRSAPKPKVWNLMGRGPTISSTEERDMTGLLSAPVRTPGEPFSPLGNPLADGVGTAAYAMRDDHPDLTFDHQLPKIVPLRAAPEYHVAEEDPDVRGWTLVAADGVSVGLITDLWVDRSDVLLRYLEAAVEGPSGRRQVVFPIGNGVFDSRKKIVKVNALLSHQIAAAPMLKNAETITLREEDMVSAYFAGGMLYATPGRSEPML
jgi:photosynthetic reaction center H subunit